MESVQSRQWNQQKDWGLGDWSLGRSDESDSDSNADSTGTCALLTLLALHDASRRGVLGLKISTSTLCPSQPPGRCF